MNRPKSHQPLTLLIPLLQYGFHSIYVKTEGYRIYNTKSGANCLCDKMQSIFSSDISPNHLNQ